MLDSNGNLVTVPGLNGPLITDPWDLTINDQGSTAQVYVSNVSGTAGANGTVVRIDLSIIGGVITVVDEVEIGNGYPTRPDMAAFVVGPGGLAFDPAQPHAVRRLARRYGQRHRGRHDLCYPQRGHGDDPVTEGTWSTPTRCTCTGRWGCCWRPTAT